MGSIDLLATVCFAAALIHTFAASQLKAFGSRFREGSVAENFFHLAGEVEVVFGLWASVFLVFAGFLGESGFPGSVAYLEGLNFTEPLFVVAVLAIAATRPVIEAATRAPTCIGCPRTGLRSVWAGISTSWPCRSVSRVSAPAA